MYIFGNSEDERLYGEFTFNRKKQSIYIPLINRNIVSKSFKLYTVTSIPRIVHRRCLEIISRLLNINIFYKKVANRSLNIDIKNILDNIYKNYSVAICVCNNNESGNYILQIMDNNSDIKAYGKLAKRKESAKFIVNENQNIEYLNKLNLESIDIPKIIYFDDINNIIIQSTRNDLKDDKGKLSINHINFFSELYQKTKTSCNFKDSSSYRHILEIKYRFNNEDINRLIDKVLNELINKYNIKKGYYAFHDSNDTTGNRAYFNEHAERLNEVDILRLHRNNLNDLNDIESWGGSAFIKKLENDEYLFYDRITAAEFIIPNEFSDSDIYHYDTDYLYAKVDDICYLLNTQGDIELEEGCVDQTLVGYINSTPIFSNDKYLFYHNSEGEKVNYALNYVTGVGNGKFIVRQDYELGVINLVVD